MTDLDLPLPDVTAFYADKANPAASRLNIPPSAHQKATMQRSNLEMMIASKTCQLLLPTVAARVIFAHSAAADLHDSMLEPSAMSTLSLNENLLLLNLLRRTTLEIPGLDDIMPTFHGCKISTGQNMAFIDHDGVKHDIFTVDFSQVLHFLTEDNVSKNARAIFFGTVYMLDCLEYLTVPRGPGERARRITSLYPNKDMIDDMLHRLKPFTNITRKLLMRGADLDEITLNDMMAVSAEAHQK